MEADVGHENTHYQKQDVDPEMWEGWLGKQVNRAGQWGESAEWSEDYDPEGKKTFPL